MRKRKCCCHRPWAFPGPPRSDAPDTRSVERSLDHWVRRNVDLSGYNVLSTADDIDELRAKLDYEKVKLFGESFGAHHALAVSPVRSNRAESAALSAVIAPDDMFKLPASVERQLAQTE